MNRILILLGAALLASCSSAPSPELASRHSHPDPEAIKRKMRETVVEKVDLRGVALSEAVGWWNTAGLKDAGWNVIVNPAGSTNTAVKITIVGRQMNAFDLLNEICNQANLTWILTDRVVYIRPRP